MQFAKNTGKIS